MPNKGYDYFIVDPGTKERMQCQVCQTECDIRQNVYGPTSFSTAMARDFRLHDVFICPHTDERWHEQALQLVVEIENTPSKRVAQLMQQDLEDLLQQNNIQ
jgi:hypothetical protein